MDNKILHSRYEENSKCEFHKYKYVDENRIKKPCYCDRCVESYSKVKVDRQPQLQRGRMSSSSPKLI